MASAIKVEVDQLTKLSLCHGCLCQDRKLKPLSGEIYKVYYSLLGSGVLYGSEEHMVCWECEAMLRRVRKFQNQILRAQTELLELFYKMSPKLQVLSNLSITKRDHYDLYYEYIEKPNSNDKPNEYLVEIIPNPQPTTEQTFTKNCTVKLEKLKQEPGTSQESDDDNFLDNDTKIEIKNETTENNPKTKTEDKPEKKRKKDTNMKRQLSKYLKYVTVTDLNAKFESVEPFFVQEYLDYEEIDEKIIRPDKALPYNRCCKCKLNFRDKNLLLLHRNLVHFEPDCLLTCLICNKELPDFEKLKSHCKYTHCGFWKCNLCQYYCRKGGRLKHLYNQHTKAYTCKKCMGVCRNEKLFLQHYKELHDTFVCHHCNRLCRDRTAMIKHLVVHADKHICSICNKSYETYRYLKRHLNHYHPEIINKKVDKEAAYCVECNIQFKTVTIYRKHLYDSPRHNKKAPQSIPCPVCGKVFSMKKYMKNHLYQKHMTEKAKWKCTICDRLFANNWGLKAHIKNVHLKVPKEKNEFCDLCGRAFHSKQTLVKHRRIHTGERPYQCTYCSAAFTQRTPLVAHQRSHHRDMFP